MSKSKWMIRPGTIFCALGELLVCIISFILGEGYNIVVSVCILLINLHTLLHVRRSWHLLLITTCIMYSNYSICFANYFGHIVTMYNAWRDQPCSALGMRILLVYSAILDIILTGTDRSEDSKINKSIVADNESNGVITVFTILLLVGVLIFGYARPEIHGDRGSPSAFYEYSIILFLYGAYYAGKNRGLYLIYTLLMVAFATQNFIFGGRITGLQLIFSWALCFHTERIRFRYVAVCGLAVFVLMIAIGIERGSIALIDFDFTKYRDVILDHSFALDTAYSSYYTSLTFIKSLDFTSLARRVEMFFSFLLALVIGGTATTRIGLIPTVIQYTAKYFVHSGGGVYPIYGYFYLGIFGAIVFSLYGACIIRSAAAKASQGSRLWRIVLSYISISAFRWYLYSPAQITRGVVLCIIWFYVLRVISNFTVVNRKPKLRG